MVVGSWLRVRVALLEQGVRPDDLQRFISTSTLLRFCDISSRPLGIAVADCGTSYLGAPGHPRVFEISHQKLAGVGGWTHLLQA